jgi:tetratricopeptide (TPR) repeat protein
MQFKNIFTIISAILVIGVMIFYFALSSSYQKSASAKVYYYLSEYDNAYRVAKEAYELDIYNRMAFSIMTQSELALRYLSFIDEANKYYTDINSMINSQSFIDKGDKYKIKMMTDIIIDKFQRLKPTRITDDELVKEAEKIYKEFTLINEKINEKL